MERPDTERFLSAYVNERLPELPMGSFELEGDEPSFAVDKRFVPLRDTTSQRAWCTLNSLLLELLHGSSKSMDANTLNLSVDQEFAVHAAAFAIKGMDRDELEETFIDMLHQKMMDRQLFFNILKEHGIDAEISFNYSTASQLS